MKDPVMKTISEQVGKQLHAMSISTMTTFGQEVGISRVAFDTEEDEPVMLVGLIGPVENLSANHKAEIEKHASQYKVRFDFLGRITTAV
jgi:hypothetical protein